MMSKCKFILIGCLLSTLCHANWTTSTPLPISSTYTFTYDSVFCSCDPTTGMYLATWTDGNTQHPTYSFFTPNIGWSDIGKISNTSQPLPMSNVITSCDPVSGKFIATWTENVSNYPSIAIYTQGSGWSLVNSLTTSTASVNTSNSFDSNNGQFLVTWADPSNNNYPTYAFYNPNVGWGSVATISNSSTAANVYTTFDSTTNQFLAVWSDTGSGHPMYSFYNSGFWSAALPISIDASVDNDVLCSCNPATGEFIATWADINQHLYPFFSVYKPGIGWSPIDTITTSSSVTDNVTITCDLTTGEYLASWSDDSNLGHPTYSFYTPAAGWSQIAVISTISSTGGDIITCFNSSTGQFLATWSDNSNPNQIFNPTYSFFTYISPLPPPPASFTGNVLSNRFLFQVDVLNELKWTPPLDSSTILSYQISRNGLLIAEIPATGPFTYIENNLGKMASVYSIVSVNGQGLESTPLTVTLQ